MSTTSQSRPRGMTYRATGTSTCDCLKQLTMTSTSNNLALLLFGRNFAITSYLNFVMDNGGDIEARWGGKTLTFSKKDSSMAIALSRLISQARSPLLERLYTLTVVSSTTPGNVPWIFGPYCCDHSHALTLWEQGNNSLSSFGIPTVARLDSLWISRSPMPPDLLLSRHQGGAESYRTWI